MGARGAVTLLLGATLLTVAAPAPAAAKEHGIQTPSGRRIYDPDERLAELYEQDSRQFVIEVVMGAAAEGNLGANLGWLAPDLGGLEFYVGLGVQTNPSHQWAASTRYFLHVGGWKPFLSMGYTHQVLSSLGTRNDSLFWELGHKWRVHHTYHFTLGLGLRYLLDVRVDPDSPLLGGDVDSTALQRELDDLGSLVPTISFRFSRAF